MNKIQCFPATDRWDDLEILFGPQGAYWGCWCTYNILSNKNFNEIKPASRKEIIKNKILNESIAPGMIAYIDNHPVGWMAMSPKETYARLMKSRIIKPIDNKPVWSITCFFIHKGFRGKGVSKSLIKSGIEYAKENGVKLVESYPIECVKGEKVKPDSAYVGLSTQFSVLEFVKVSNTKAKSGGKPRIIMRKEI